MKVAPCSTHSATSATPTKIAVRLEQVPEVAGVLVVGADRQAVQQVAEHDPDQERRQQARHGQQPAPGPAPAPRRVLAPVLERHAAQDERHAAAGRSQGRSLRTSWRTSRGTRRTWQRRRRRARPRSRPTRVRWCSARPARPASSLPMTPCSMPTPMSKPSSTKNPVHRTVIRMNQSGTKAIGRLSTPSPGRARRTSLSAGAGGSSLREYRSMSSRSTVPRVP